MAKSSNADTSETEHLFSIINSVSGLYAKVGLFCKKSSVS